jgi:hypothetical protein
MASLLHGPYRIAIDDDTLDYKVNPSGADMAEIHDVFFASKQEADLELERQIQYAQRHIDEMSGQHYAEHYKIEATRLPGLLRILWRIVDEDREDGTDTAMLVFPRDRTRYMQMLLANSVTLRITALTNQLGDMAYDSAGLTKPVHEA